MFMNKFHQKKLRGKVKRERKSILGRNWMLPPYNSLSELGYNNNSNDK